MEKGEEHCKTLILLVFMLCFILKKICIFKGFQYKKRGERVEEGSLLYLHELKRCFKILDRIHLYSEELDPHDEANGTLHYIWTLLFLPQLLQLSHKLFLHSRKPEKKNLINRCLCLYKGACTAQSHRSKNQCFRRNVELTVLTMLK